MRGKEARKKCPELQLVQVPLTHGKAELGPYRAAGKQVRRLREATPLHGRGIPFRAPGEAGEKIHNVMVVSQPLLLRIYLLQAG